MRVDGGAVGRVTSGGYGYTVERSIAYAYLPAEHARPGQPVEVEIFGDWVARRGRGRAALRPRRRADPRMIDEVVERVWPGGVESVEPLGGGITNHNFKVVAGGEAFVLRIGGNDTDLLGIDRRVEHEASLAAAALGIGPEVVAFVEPEGYLVTRFVEGEVGRFDGGRGRGAAAAPARRPGDPGPVRLVPRRRGATRDSRGARE